MVVADAVGSVVVASFALILSVAADIIVVWVSGFAAGRALFFSVFGVVVAVVVVAAVEVGSVAVACVEDALLSVSGGIVAFFGDDVALNRKSKLDFDGKGISLHIFENDSENSFCITKNGLGAFDFACLEATTSFTACPGKTKLMDTMTKVSPPDTESPIRRLVSSGYAFTFSKYSQNFLMLVCNSTQN